MPLESSKISVEFFSAHSNFFAAVLKGQFDSEINEAFPIYQQLQACFSPQTLEKCRRYSHKSRSISPGWMTEQEEEKLLAFLADENNRKMLLIFILQISLHKFKAYFLPILETTTDKTVEEIKRTSRLSVTFLKNYFESLKGPDNKNFPIKQNKQEINSSENNNTLHELIDPKQNIIIENLISFFNFIKEFDKTVEEAEPWKITYICNAISLMLLLFLSPFGFQGFWQKRIDHYENLYAFQQLYITPIKATPFWELRKDIQHMQKNEMKQTIPVIPKPKYPSNPS